MPVAKRTSRTLVTLLGFFLILCRLPGVAAAAPTDISAELVTEYHLKSAFLLNFLKFTTWPATALPEKTPLRVGVLASPAVQAIVANALKGKSVDTHTVEVLKMNEGDNWQNCHLLFVAHDQNLSPATIRTQLGTAPVLLVGETEQFSLTGGMIGFVQRGTNIRFQVNLAQAQACQLKLSARLASLAEIVKSFDR